MLVKCNFSEMFQKKKDILRILCLDSRKISKNYQNTFRLLEDLEEISKYS